MKKILYIFLILLSFYSFAECTLPQNDNKNCDKCVIDDDEYCIYNECYFDREFRKLKIELSLNETQEKKIDNIYKIYKLDMEALCEKYSFEKNKILALIASDNPCWKKKTKHLDRLKNDIKVRFICLSDDIEEILDKCQKKKFNYFKSDQKKKIKLILKYGAVYKFPCEE